MPHLPASCGARRVPCTMRASRQRAAIAAQRSLGDHRESSALAATAGIRGELQVRSTHAAKRRSRRRFHRRLAAGWPQRAQRVAAPITILRNVSARCSDYAKTTRVLSRTRSRRSDGSRRCPATIRSRSSATSWPRSASFARSTHDTRRRGSKRCSASTSTRSALRESLVTQYLEHASRSSKIENQLWQALFELSQGFLACYGEFAREIARHAQSKKWQTLLPELIARQIIHHGLDARIRLFRYEQWIPAKWTELHALFTLACSRQIERHPVVADAGGDTTTIEHEYLVALILQLVNSGNMTPKHVDWVSSHLDEWCQPLRLTLEPSSVTSFYVDLGSRAGLRRRVACAARRPRALSRHATAARAADAERRRAGAEDQEPAAVGKDRRAGASSSRS